MAALATGQSGNLSALTLYDFSDRELLLIVMEVCDAADGYASSMDIAEALGMRGKHPQSSVGSRMAALARIGAVIKDPEAPANANARWAVSPIGASIAQGRMKQSMQRSVENMDEGQLILLTRAVTQRHQASGQTVGKLLAREWRNGTGLR